MYYSITQSHVIVIKSNDKFNIKFINLFCSANICRANVKSNVTKSQQEIIISLLPIIVLNANGLFGEWQAIWPADIHPHTRPHQQPTSHGMAPTSHATSSTPHGISITWHGTNLTWHIKTNMACRNPALYRPNQKEPSTYKSHGPCMLHVHVGRYSLCPRGGQGPS